MSKAEYKFLKNSHFCKNPQMLFFLNFRVSKEAGLIIDERGSAVSG